MSRFARIRSCVDVEALDHFHHRDHCAGRTERDLRQRSPFGRPVAEPPLVLLHGSRQHRRYESGHAHRRLERDRRTDRIAFLRHRRRSAASRQRGFLRFTDFRLGEQRDVARELAERRRQHAER
jgi:hypothetical protein